MVVLSYVMGPLLLHLLQIFLILHKLYSIFERLCFVCLFTGLINQWVAVASARMYFICISSVYSLFLHFIVLFLFIHFVREQYSSTLSGVSGWVLHFFRVFFLLSTSF